MVRAKMTDNVSLAGMQHAYAQELAELKSCRAHCIRSATGSAGSLGKELAVVSKAECGILNVSLGFL